MFNPLTRTLKGGLTALAILTAGGFAFAPTAAEAQATEPQIAKCNSNPFGTGDSFGTGGCGVTLGTEQFSTAKEQYCDKDINRSKPICRPTAERWRFENPAAPASPDTATSGNNFRRDQFLRGTANGVNEGTGLTVHSWQRNSLNLSTAKFGRGSGEALGGSATDGVSFFTGSTGSGNQRRYYGYAGIYTGTDLGAPITETRGTAKWVGKFRAFAELYPYYLGPRVTVRDFILEIDYATRSLDAFIFHVTDHSVTLNGFYQLDGHYDSSGVITGEFELSGYNNGDRTNRRFIGRKGSVTGLIGEEGAVGAFHSGRDDDTSSSRHHTYAGGFVARPAADVTGAVAYLDRICSDNPFLDLCFTSNQRATRILADCRGVRTSTSPAYCSDATVACVNNPFGTDCHKTLGGYALNIARTNRITFCNNAETPTNDSACTPTEVVDAVCDDNIFGRGCVSSTGYNDRLTERISFCNIYANLRDRKCTPNKVLVEVCKVNLFGVGCMNSRLYDEPRIACNTEEGKDATACRTPRAIAAICDADLFGVGCKSGTGYAPRLPKRISFCNIETNLEDQKCTHADAVSAVCDANLFGLGCVSSADPDGSYASERTDRLELCDTDSENALCSGTKRDNICSYAPFSSVCLGHADSADMRTASKFNACRKPGPDNLTCHGIRQGSGKADAATWEDSFMTLSNLKGISSVTSVDASDVKYRTNQFVKGLQRNGDYSNLRTRGKTPLTFLTLGDNLVGSSTETLGGEFEDGVGFFGLKVGYGVFPFHAGILSGTDLGAPITRTSEAKAIWSGVFQAIGGKGRATHRNFDLTINFIADNAGGTIDAFVQNTGDKYYHLSGNFDSIGVITGRVDYGPFDSSKNPTGDSLPGRLAGLIGEQGAVGAFIANMDNYGSGFYAGGFVARDVVNYVDWAAEADPLDTLPTTTTNTRNHAFVSGELADKARLSEKLNLRAATYNGYRLNGDSTDGVAFFKRPANSFPATHYAGVLSGTDLGSLIVQPNTRAYWSGSLRVVTVPGIQDAVDFVLEVAFTDNGGSILAEALNAAYSRGNPQTVHLDGTFGFNGVITGTSRVGSSSFGDGKLRGLIGQDGAVGTFVSTRGVEYSGGFVARPHSVNIRDLQNYATLETKPIRALNDTGGFLKASLPNGQLDLPNLRDIPSGFYLNSNTIGRRDGDTNDGYQYFGIINDEGETEFNRYYAGILATTNLGAPLVTPAKDAPTKTAIWHGHTSFGISSSAQNISTKFYLNFNDGIIGFANEAENGTERLTIIPKNDYSSGVYLTLNGKFGPGDSSLSLGQLGGDMQANTVNGGAPLPVTGLIGQDGVVGVFVYQSTDSGSAGGFTASPQ